MKIINFLHVHRQYFYSSKLLFRVPCKILKVMFLVVIIQNTGFHSSVKLLPLFVN